MSSTVTPSTASDATMTALPQVNPQRDYKIAWVATFLFFVAYYALIVPLPRYLSGIGLPDWQVGLVLGATAIASLITRPISGVLTDRFGHRRMMLFGALWLTVGAIGVVMTTQIVILFGLRILQALGYVIFTTAGNALVGQLATPAERSQKIAYFGLAANFAMTMTPGAMDTILPWIGLLAAFWLAGGMLWGLFSIFYNSAGTPFDFLGCRLCNLWPEHYRHPPPLWALSGSLGLWPRVSCRSVDYGGGTCDRGVWL